MKTLLIFPMLLSAACVAQSSQAPVNTPAPQAQPQAQAGPEETETSQPAGEQQCTECFPAYGVADQLVLKTHGGSLGQGAYSGMSREESYSRQFAYLYSQTEKVEEGQAQLTYTLHFLGKPEATVGEHEITEGFKVYGFGGPDDMVEYFFAGKVRIDEIDKATGRFKFAYYGNLAASGGEPTPVQGAADLTVPLVD